MNPIFEALHLKKSFGGLVAVNDVSFQLYPGEILGIIGPNGAGKSTLFNLLAGAIRPDSGEVRFENQIVSEKKDYELCRLGIARTFQIVKPFRDMTVFENVMAAAYLRHKDKSHAEQVALEMIERMKLKHKTHFLAGSLTLPEMKRLEVTRALATNPRILMLDEVLAGLNPSEVTEMVPIIRSIVEDKRTSILIIEHVLYALMSLAHLLRTYAHPDDIEARAQVHLASTIAGMAFGLAGVGLVHSCSHPMSAVYHVPHGLANAIILPYVLEYNLISNYKKFADIARVFDPSLVLASDEEAARNLVSLIREFTASMDIPDDFSYLGIEVTDEVIQRLSDDAMDDKGTIPVNPRKVYREDVVKIYQQVLPLTRKEQ